MNDFRELKFKYSLTTVDQNLFWNYMHAFEIFDRILKSFMKMII